MNKIWKTPEIIILVKKNSDELMIDYCKGSNGTPSGTYGGCLVIDSSGSGATGTEGPGNPYYCAYDHCSTTVV